VVQAISIIENMMAHKAANVMRASCQSVCGGEFEDKEGQNELTIVPAKAVQHLDFPPDTTANSQDAQ